MITRPIASLTRSIAANRMIWQAYDDIASFQPTSNGRLLQLDDMASVTVPDHSAIPRLKLPLQ